MSKPKPPPHQQPARPAAGKKRSGSAARKPSWVVSGRVPGLLLTVAVGVAVVAVVLLAGRPSGPAGQPAGGTRAVGQPAPAVQLPATSGQTVDVANFRGKRNVLLYFYEHAG